MRLALVTIALLTTPLYVLRLIEEKILSKFDEPNNQSMNKLLKDTALGSVSQLITTLISYLSETILDSLDELIITEDGANVSGGEKRESV